MTDSKDVSKYVPEGMTWIRAAVSSIPMVGGALDHLIFDKADAIRLKNIEAAIKALEDQIKQSEQQQINKDWFSSVEALAAFKLMADSVSYEPDPKKVEDMGRLIASCGGAIHANDPKKISVVEHLSRLSHVQIKLLSVIAKVAMREHTVSTGGLEQKAMAIWISDIMSTLRAGPKFWDGTMKLDEELEILESLNTIRRVQLMGPAEAAYIITGIGKHAAGYVQSAGL